MIKFQRTLGAGNTDMAGEFVTRTWSPGALGPSTESKAFDGDLALDCTLLGVTDGSVSRAENAPRIRALTVWGEVGDF